MHSDAWQKRKWRRPGSRENSHIWRGIILAYVHPTMLGLNGRQRSVISDKVPDVANLIAAAIVVGFMLGEPTASRSMLVAGILVWAGALIFAVGISRGR